jgi:chemotaxis response regulator CheB
MGRDGAEGLLALHSLGWRTIAQDESSSVVWGMPKAAIEIGAADQVLPHSQIAEAITRLVLVQTQNHAEARAQTRPALR